MRSFILKAPRAKIPRGVAGNGRARAWRAGVVCCVLAVHVCTGYSQEARDPLLDLMIEKGMVTQEEARKVRIEADALRTNAAAITSESKWKINKAIKSVEIYGDMRVRYENRQVSAPDDSRIELNRERAALRVGLRGDIVDDFYYGFRLDTSSNPRSPWVTFGTSSSGVPYYGPFGKSTDGLDIGQVYIGWHPTSWLDVTVGKMDNPLYTTAMVWDSDLTPEGAAERFRRVVGRADFFATFGQFLYQDANPTHTAPGLFNLGFENSSPAFLLAWQGGVTYHLTDKLSMKIAPVLYNYVGEGVNGNAPGSALTPDFSGTFVGQGSTNTLTGNGQGWSGYNQGYYDGFTANQTGINDLLVLEVPWEFNLKLDKVNLRLFGDYAQNLEGGGSCPGCLRRLPIGIPTPGRRRNRPDPIPADQGYQGLPSGFRRRQPRQPGPGLWPDLQETWLGGARLLAAYRAIRPRPEPAGLRLLRRPWEHGGHFLRTGLRCNRQCHHHLPLRLRQPHQ